MAWVNDPARPGNYKYVPDEPAATPAAPAGIATGGYDPTAQPAAVAAPPPPQASTKDSSGWYTELGKVGDQAGMDYWNSEIKNKGYDQAYNAFRFDANNNLAAGKAVGSGDIPKVTAPVTTAPVTAPTATQTSQYQVNGQTINSPTYSPGYNPAQDFAGEQYTSNSSNITPNQALADYDRNNAALKISDPAKFNLERSRAYEASQMAQMTPQQRADWEILQGQPSEKYINQGGAFVPNPNYNPFFELKYNSDPGLAAKYQEGYTYNPDGSIRSTTGARGTTGNNTGGLPSASGGSTTPTNPYSPVTSGGGGIAAGGSSSASSSSSVNPAQNAGVVTGANGASNYNPAQLGNPTQWNVTAPQTVAGQVQALSDPNGALGKQAIAQGLTIANDRGLINSSIAQTAAQTSLNNLALQIASADAATNAKAGGYNADMNNQFATQNTNSQNTAQQFNAGQNNNLQLGNLQSQTSLATTQMNNASAQATAQLQAKTEEFKAKLNAGTQLTLADKEAYTKLQLADADAKTRINLANIDAKTRADLGVVEANYKNVLQTNQSAATLYQQTTQNIAQIQMSKDLDAAAKDQAIKNQQTVLADGLKILGGISGLNIGDLVIAPTTTATGTATGAVTTTTPTANAYVAAVTEGH
jgi:hypothetical protein